jgi:hypothetical protein
MALTRRGPITSSSPRADVAPPTTPQQRFAHLDLDRRLAVLQALQRQFGALSGWECGDIEMAFATCAREEEERVDRVHLARWHALTTGALPASADGQMLIDTVIADEAEIEGLLLQQDRPGSGTMRREAFVGIDQDRDKADYLAVRGGRVGSFPFAGHEWVYSLAEQVDAGRFRAHVPEQVVWIRGDTIEARGYIDDTTPMFAKACAWGTLLALRVELSDSFQATPLPTALPLPPQVDLLALAAQHRWMPLPEIDTLVGAAQWGQALLPALATSLASDWNRLLHDAFQGAAEARWAASSASWMYMRERACHIGADVAFVSQLD